MKKAKNKCRQKAHAKNRFFDLGYNAFVFCFYAAVAVRFLLLWYL